MRKINIDNMRKPGKRLREKDSGSDGGLKKGSEEHSDSCELQHLLILLVSTKRISMETRGELDHVLGMASPVMKKRFCSCLDEKGERGEKIESLAIYSKSLLSLVRDISVMQRLGVDVKSFFDMLRRQAQVGLDHVRNDSGSSGTLNE